MEFLLIASWVVFGILGMIWANQVRPCSWRIGLGRVVLGWAWVGVMAYVAVRQLTEIATEFIHAKKQTSKATV